MTGETENGRSISVSSRFLPRKSNFAIAHAAATPKTRFIGTEIPAASSVSFSAENASGSVSAAQYTSTPLENASTNTAASGTNRKTDRNSSAPAISAHRTHAARLVAQRGGMRVGASGAHVRKAGRPGMLMLTSPGACASRPAAG